ncbi:serine hydrolase domain-containing protein [Nakamurella lactea]|uniref:serine hydrolase domain-containing protein n=1 Tax=Nakamurella lactea TaxID=459515 RepID=UPI00042A05DD|nr:serine hydrolase domain-containing protein [Nakamurella lactea]
MQPNGATETLDAAIRFTLRAGVPGAHLSVRAPGAAADRWAGAAQEFDDAGRLHRPLTADTAHDLGSVTKIVGTTAMLMALASAGELSVDHRLDRFLDIGSQVSAGTTLRDLLTHRSGLWEWWPTYLEPADPLATVLALPLRYPPRTGRHYSDLGFMILGRVVETVTGQRLPAALVDLVCGPLGIVGLQYGAPPPDHPVAASSRGDRIERQMVSSGQPYPVRVDASGFDGWRERVLVGEVNDGNAFHAFGGAAGHAGLFGTVTALHQFGAAVLAARRREGARPAAAGFFEVGPDPGQLLGFRSWRDSCAGCSAELIGHTGFPGIGLAVIPEHDATLVLATNRLHVDTEPAAFGPLWDAALAAGHRFLHSDSLQTDSLHTDSLHTDEGQAEWTYE